MSEGGASSHTVDAESIAKRVAPYATRELREPRLGLALSGGGYRAMLFHVGAVLRLNELGFLDAVDRVSTVSGGSITAAALATEWEQRDTDGAGAGSLAGFANRLRDLAGRTIDTRSVIGGLLPGVSAARLAAGQYRRLLGNSSIQDLPDHPRFSFSATNFVTGALVRWSKEYVADYRLGTVFAPDTPVADVVAASSAFPPFLSPMALPAPGIFVDHDTKVPLPDQPKRLVLTDGGVYDNLGLEPLKSFHSVLVSDGGSPFDVKAKAPMNWFSQSLRTTAIINSQVRAVRKREFVSALTRGERLGALWTIATPMNRYSAKDLLPVNPATALMLARVPTRLRALADDVQQRLVNWGYAQADAALRSHVEPSLPAPVDWPYPAQALG